MNCRRVQHELSAYVDGELSTAVQAELQTHLTGCDDCQRRLAELRKLSESLAALPQVRPGSQYVADVRRRIRHATAPAAKTSWVDLLFRPLWLKIPVEATAVILALFFVVHMVQPGRQAMPARVAKLESAERPTATILTEEAATRDDRRPVAELDEKAADALQPAEITARKAPAFAASTPAPAPAAPAGGAADGGRAMAEVAKSRPQPQPAETEALVTTMGKELVGDVGGVRPATARDLSVTDRLVVRTANPAGVRARAKTLAQAMNATVIDAAKQDEPPSRFYVRLPVAQVAQFKTQLVATADQYKTKESLRSGEGRTREGSDLAGPKQQFRWAEDRDRSVSELKLGVARADNLAKATAPVAGTNELARQPSKPVAETTVIEIQVLPPAP